MQQTKISPDELTQTLKQVYQTYSDEVLKTVDTAVKETGEETAKNLKGAGDFRNRSGKYRRGWKVQITEGRLGLSATVYQGAKPTNLTSWLEFGHAKAGGGRVQAHPHIAEANEQAQKTLVETITKKVEAIQ